MKRAYLYNRISIPVLRCVINNAAVMVFGEFEWQTYGQLKNQLEVNFLGAMIVTQELMPIIRAHYSRIIVVSSHCKAQPIPGASVYSGTKAAISAWATGLRVELKKYGIKVVSVVPGNQGIAFSNINTRFFHKKRAVLCKKYFAMLSTCVQ